MKPAVPARAAVDHQAPYREDLLRTTRVVDARAGVVVEIDGRRLINFCSNDYLDLAGHAEVAAAMQDAATAFGVGSTASPLVCGKTRLHAALEDRLAALTGRDRALLFNCGYTANLAIFSALVHARHETVFEDRLCHASMVDGARLAGARLKRYRHADPADLERLLRAAPPGGLKLVLTESVFSMDGDVAPLPGLVRVCQEYGASLVVDEAHGFGVLGERGLGALDRYGLDQDAAPLMMATFGKAIGVGGAFVAGRADLVEALAQRARPYIYSTALPVPVVAAVQKSLDILENEPWRRQRLQALAGRLQDGLVSRGHAGAGTGTPIQPLVVGGARAALEASARLESSGYFIRAIRPPTVPPNTSRLRIAVSAGHTAEQVDGLLAVLPACLPQVPAGRFE